jgi:hypothetical protein
MTMSEFSRPTKNPYADDSFISRKSRLWIVIGFMLLLWVAGSWSSQYIHGQLWPLDTEQTQLFIGLLVLVYAVCMILPFMPAIELGLVLLAMLDIPGVLMLYLLTVVALMISYGVGKLIPIHVLKRLFDFLHFPKASELLCSAEVCDEKEQISRFIEHAPKRMIPFLLRHRYCVFAVAINTPGNMVIGGAGGIAMMSGLSRLFGFRQFALTILIAVSPLPILTILSKLMIIG